MIYGEFRAGVSFVQDDQNAKFHNFVLNLLLRLKLAKSLFDFENLTICISLSVLVVLEHAGKGGSSSNYEIKMKHVRLSKEGKYIFFQT